MHKFILDQSQKYITTTTDSTIQMCDLYHEVAIENYYIYLEKIKQMELRFDAFHARLEHMFDGAYEEFKEKDLFPKGLENFEILGDKSLNKYEVFFTHPNETKDIINLIMKSVVTTEAYKDADLTFENESFELEAKEIMKSGVKAIAFEAFACEAALNQEVQRFLSKSQIKKLKAIRGEPSYISKLKKIVEYKKNNNNLEIIFNELQNLMSVRNKIAHFHEYTFDIKEMFNYFERKEENIENNQLYIGELFKILNNEDFEVYESLLQIIK